MFIRNISIWLTFLQANILLLPMLRLTFPNVTFSFLPPPQPFIHSFSLTLHPASGPATPDSVENVTQHLSPESTRKAYWRTWDGSTGGQHMPPSPNVFSDHSTGSNMSPGGGLSHLKSPAPGRTRSVSDSSAPRRGTNCVQIFD